MTARRGRGEGSVFQDSERRCYVGVLDLGADPATGKRRRKVSAPTVTAVREKLKALRKELEDTGPAASRADTVGAVVGDWLDNLPRRIRDQTSVRLVQGHGARITRELGTVPVRKLEARQVERFLRGMAAEGLSTSTIQQVHRVLARSLDRMVRNRKVAVNVARVAEVPEGTRRRSRSMTGAQARQLLSSDLDVWWRAYFTLALYWPAAGRADRAPVGGRGFHGWRHLRAAIPQAGR